LREIVEHCQFWLKPGKQKGHYTPGSINPYPVGNIFPATKCHVACGDNENEKTYFNHFPDKAEIERRRNFENWWAFELWRHALYY